MDQQVHIPSKMELRSIGVSETRASKPGGQLVKNAILITSETVSRLEGHPTSCRGHTGRCLVAPTITVYDTIVYALTTS